ncbi:unnamed protein product [Trifolium pratense]|uniref:Uncharacterized protein n=1 Tax=Trifolium pratense TaxID=57577 RepID=A0ACB0M181_TRIPR|nr:unnamed protein product [Trifolium pratense]
MKKVLKNNVINNLTRILGLVCDQNVLGKKNGVDIRKSLRYGRILLMMDQDHDGSHIKGLVINLIHRMWPTLVRTTDCQFIYQFTTPIVKATHSKSDMVKSFYTIQAFEDWRKDENDVSSWTTKYYKGLGNSTDQEAIDYFKEMDKSINIFTWKDELDSKAIEVAFDKTKVKDRRDWILSFQAGKDHASHRYLNTELSPVTRYLFCNDDDKILNYNMDENGKTIEPKWFLPVIPMVLVNGSQGIGIGWNSFVPKYNPKDIINNIKRKFNGESLEEDKMTPWYKGFKGTIVRKDKGIYHIDGLVTHGKGYTYHIKELPIGTSIEGYKKYLKSISKGTAKNNTPLIKEFEQIGNSRTVGFHIEFIQAPSKDDDLIEILNLRTTISTNDMHLYNKRNHIEKFNSAEKILEHFYYERLEKYKKRWDVMLQNIESDLIDMENTKKFVMLARSRKFDFLTEDSKDLRKICMDHNIAADSIQSLLSLPLSAFSNEGLKKVEDKIQEKEEEKNALFNKTEIQLWKDDLDTFEEEWQKEEASWKSDTMSQACPICEPPINSNADMGQELLGRGKRTIKKPGHLNAFYLE